MLVQKNKRETEKELSHTDLYWDGTFIGYLIRNKSKFANVGENWNFVSKHNKLMCMYERTKGRLIDLITTECYKNKL
jgi:hypothetical protein